MSHEKSECEILSTACEQEYFNMVLEKTLDVTIKDEVPADVDMDVVRSICIKSYANSLARYFFFKDHLDDNHPAVEAEVQLLNAKLGALDLILKKVLSDEETKTFKQFLKGEVLKEIHNKLSSMTDSLYTINKVMGMVYSSDIFSKI